MTNYHKLCQYCREPFTTGHTRGRYCSLHCAGMGKSRPHTEETRKKISIAMKGVKPKHPVIITCKRCGKQKTTAHPEQLFCSRHCALLGHTYSPEQKRKIGDAQRGAKSYLWQGGKTTINRLVRKGIEAREWRKAVFTRDGYRCFGCGTQSGPFNGHHIYPWAHFPRLRFVIENGITLCVFCHDLIPRTLGRPDNIVAPAGFILNH
jgi:5-methylcytosine-specific restriction endonuclease McrA